MAMSVQKRNALIRVQQAQSRLASEHDAWRLAIRSHQETIDSCLANGMTYGAGKATSNKIHSGHQDAFNAALKELLEAEKDYLAIPA
ncbi:MULTISPECIES: hypothetical protein [Burkholderia]|uniref:hypothetical protein n=1 Tax=Burkholderia TaxID=32008 RepID=UPI00126A486B|nr:MULTISPECIES: hypothetical protein [Burkholderia]